MAGSVNKVTLIGNLGQDPEIRYTQNQIPVVTMNIATSEYRQGADGQKQETTEWHRVIAWNKLAENCHKYLVKGKTIYVDGKLQTRSWDDKTGQKRYTTEIVAQNIQFLSPAAGQGKTDQGVSGGYAPRDQDNPYGQGHQPTALPDFDLSIPSSGSSDKNMMDDIPF